MRSIFVLDKRVLAAFVPGCLSASGLEFLLAMM
jgi:hypothetical protein